MGSEKRHIAIIKEAKHKKTISNIKSTPLDWTASFFVATPLYIAWQRIRAHVAAIRYYKLSY